MSEVIKIGTRDSALALWQANRVKSIMESKGLKAKLVPVKSTGDLQLTKPLYELGIQGVFTKTLDIALLNNEIDIAVHSLKDVPTRVAQGLAIIAVPERGIPYDLLVTKEEKDLTPSGNYVLATSSLRRRAQWLNKYSDHQIENLRGNINSRLDKLLHQNWNGAIFAEVGPKRINLELPFSKRLEWMLPAPSQGALGIMARKDDDYIVEIGKEITCLPSELSCRVEREFLREMMGGCTMPIACYAKYEDNTLIATGNILTIDGKQKVEKTLSVDCSQSEGLGRYLANEILDSGGAEIRETFKKIG